MRPLKCYPDLRPAARRGQSDGRDGRGTLQRCVLRRAAAFFFKGHVDRGAQACRVRPYRGAWLSAMCPPNTSLNWRGGVLPRLFSGTVAVWCFERAELRYHVKVNGPAVPPHGSGARFAAVPSLVGAAKQHAQRKRGRVWVLFAAENFANPVCIRTQLLNNIRKGASLVYENVRRHGFILSETLALYCDIVKGHPCNWVFSNCHGSYSFGDVDCLACSGGQSGLSALRRGAVTLTGSEASTFRPGYAFYHGPNIQKQPPFAVALTKYCVVPGLSPYFSTLSSRNKFYHSTSMSANPLINRQFGGAMS